MNDEVIIAADSGDIVRVPVAALHPEEAVIAEHWQRRHETAPDFIAAQELVRFIPAQTEAFTLRWLGANETNTAVGESSTAK